MNILFLLQATPGGGYSTLFLLGGMILVFWLFMIRPQAKFILMGRILLISD